MLRQLLERLLAWLFSLWNPPPSSRVSTDVNVSADPLPEVTAGLNLAAGAVKLVAQENAEHNTPGMVNAAIETHAQAAKDAVQRAIAKGDIDALRRMAALVPMLALALLLAACGTVSPALVTEGAAKYDSSTPAPYPPYNSGLLDQVTIGNQVYEVITPNRAKNQNAAQPFVDQYGNHVFLLPADVFAAQYNAAIDAELPQRKAK